MKIEGRLITIIQNLMKAKRINNLNITDDVIFSEACSFLRGELANENWIQNNGWKFQGTQSQQTKKTNDNLPNSNSIKSADATFIPASKDQLDFIHKNEIGVNTENLSKKEAWKIIKEFKEANPKKTFSSGMGLKQ